MPDTEPLRNYPIPVGLDPPSGPTAVGDLATAVATDVVAILAAQSIQDDNIAQNAADIAGLQGEGGQQAAMRCAYRYPSSNITLADSDWTDLTFNTEDTARSVSASEFLSVSGITHTVTVAGIYIISMFGQVDGSPIDFDIWDVSRSWTLAYSGFYTQQLRDATSLTYSGVILAGTQITFGAYNHDTSNRTLYGGVGDSFVSFVQLTTI